MVMRDILKKSNYEKELTHEVHKIRKPPHPPLRKSTTETSQVPNEV